MFNIYDIVLYKVNFRTCSLSETWKKKCKKTQTCACVVCVCVCVCVCVHVCPRSLEEGPDVIKAG